MNDYTSISLLGAFEMYQPDVLPENAPLQALFMRRASDGLDWYENWGHRGDAFDADDVLATANPRGNQGFMVEAILRASELQRMPVIPAHIIVIKGVDPTIDKPHQLFEGKHLDLDALEISDFNVPLLPVITNKADIWRRATDEEADTIEAVLAQQSTRKQRIFTEAAYLDHADPLFAELMAGFKTAFGEGRASQLLAAS